MSKIEIIDSLAQISGEAQKLDLLVSMLNTQLYKNQLNEAKQLGEVVEDYSIRLKELCEITQRRIGRE